MKTEEYRFDGQELKDVQYLLDTGCWYSPSRNGTVASEITKYSWLWWKDRYSTHSKPIPLDAAVLLQRARDVSGG